MARNRIKKTDRTSRITLMLAPSTIDYIAEQASNEDRSLSAIVDEMIRQHQVFSRSDLHQSANNTKEQQAA